LNTGVDELHWIVSGYLLALALMLPLNAWLVDRVGGKTLYLVALCIFTAASTLCGFAWSSETLIGFRIMQGLSGGLLAPMAQLLIARTAGKHMTSVMSIAAIPVLLGPLLGPVVAGAILEAASWRWLFFAVLPFGVAAIAIAAVVLPEEIGARRKGGFDILGFATLTPALALFLLSLDHPSEPAYLAALGVALFLMIVFLASSVRKGRDALIDIRLFRDAIFPRATITQFLSNGASFSGQMLIPIFLVRQCGLSPGLAGLFLAPLGLGMICTYPFVGALTKRFGLRAIAVAGASLSLIGTIPLLAFSALGLVKSLFLTALFFRGLGMGGIGIPTLSAAYASIHPDDLPNATTALNIVQRFGGPVFTTLFATLLGLLVGANSSPADFAPAMLIAFVFLCGLHVLVVLAALTLPSENTDDLHARSEISDE
tara:strand:- start:25563 stop:26846 length:1284 start_codon:yes stop_codon:yes gene_type:complete